VAAGEPLYVIGIRPDEGRLLVGGEAELLSREVFLCDVNLLVPAGPGPVRVLARIRSRHPDVPALLEPAEPGLRRGGRARLVFDDPVRAAAPGQAAVFYDPDRPERLLGGGRIERRKGSGPAHPGEAGSACGEGRTV
jgi:tRNA-specific 2-thiouridylase